MISPGPRFLPAVWLQAQYLSRIFFFLPVTLVKRVLLGKDAVWKRFFFQSWGFYGEAERELLASKPNIWINTEAGGELTQLFSLCRLIKKELPQYNLVVSTHKYDSYLVASRMEGVDLALFSPWDTVFAARRALRIIRPKILLAIEVLTSPLLTIEAAGAGIPAMLCSGFMSAELISCFPPVRRAIALGGYSKLDFIGAKHEASAEGFKALGISGSRIGVLGDMKFDALYLRLDEAQKNSMRAELGLKCEEQLFVAGSVHPGEDAMIIEGYLKAREKVPSLRLLLAPRFSDMIEPLEKKLNAMDVPHIRKTRIRPGRLRETGSPVIILNTFGELNRIYALAFCCVIGSSIIPASPLGGHNIIEPLVQELPIMHGSHMQKYEALTAVLDKIWPGGLVMSSGDIASGITELAGNRQLYDSIRLEYSGISSGEKENIPGYLRKIREVVMGTK